MIVFFLRENAKRLLLENETLQDKLVQAEKDTVQVISFLKAEDVKKEEKVNDLTTRHIYIYHPSGHTFNSNMLALIMAISFFRLSNLKSS